MTIHLLRHGRTEANEKGIFCGSSDVPLSAGGIIELETLKKQGIYPKAESGYTSGLQRAKDTARLIYGNIPFRAVDDLNEYDFGIFELQSFEDIKDRADFQLWVNDESGESMCPGGESQREFVQRVLNGFNSIIDETRRSGADSALIVCHGGVIVRIMQHLFPDNDDYFQWQPDNGHGYSISLSPEPPQILNQF